MFALACLTMKGAKTEPLLYEVRVRVARSRDRGQHCRLRSWNEEIPDAHSMILERLLQVSRRSCPNTLFPREPRGGLRGAATYRRSQEIVIRCSLSMTESRYRQ